MIMKTAITMVSCVLVMLGVLYLGMGIYLGIAGYQKGLHFMMFLFVLPLLWYAVAAIAYPLAYLRNKTKRRAYSVATLCAFTLWLIIGPLADQILQVDHRDMPSLRWLASLVISIIIAVSANAIFKNLIDGSYKKSDGEGPTPNGDAATPEVNSKAAEEPPSAG